MFPALAGAFLTTGPPGKSDSFSFLDIHIHCIESAGHSLKPSGYDNFDGRTDCVMCPQLLGEF